MGLAHAGRDRIREPGQEQRRRVLGDGVRGEAGDLLLAPQLTAEQFDETGTAELRLTFAGRPLTVRYHNAARKEAGSYRLGEVRCGDTAVTPGADGTVKLPRALVEQLPAEGGLITAELV